MALFMLLLLVCSILVSYNGVNGADWNLSKDDDLKFERQLKLLNKPVIETNQAIANHNYVTKYGDLYDCVDFYKQPAFDHPLLKNYTSDFQVLPPSILKTIRDQNSNKFTKLDDIGVNALKCPVGTVPIRRVTKTDLVNNYLASKKSVQNVNPVHEAIARTKIAKYSGGGADISVHNPKVTGAQYSAARVRLSNVPDVVEAGWRVDPTLYHDTKTRFYIRTAAGGTQCYNLFCPGFVHVRHDFAIDSVLQPYSIPGKSIYTYRVFIVRDKHGNWNLQVGADRMVVGYWPSRLFRSLSGLASSILWGGETSAPPGSPFPPMGSGERFPRNDTLYDAYFSRVSTYDEAGQITDAGYLEVGSDTYLYAAYDLQYVDSNYRHVIVYSGEGGIK